MISQQRHPRGKGINPRATYFDAGMWDPEAGAWMPIFSPLFADRQARKSFVNKTLTLVLLQLLITVAASALFLYWEPLRVRTTLHFSNEAFPICKMLCHSPQCHTDLFIMRGWLHVHCT